MGTRAFANLSDDELDAVRTVSTWTNRVAVVGTVFRELVVGCSYAYPTDQLGEFVVPTVFLVGEDSPRREHQVAARLCSLIPTCEIAVLAGQRHVAYRMAPERFTTTLLTALNA